MHPSIAIQLFSTTPKDGIDSLVQENWDEQVRVLGWY